MIRRIEIQNFRSIINSSVDLQNLTVIVGANATGKSNLIKAVDFVSDIAEFGVEQAVYRRGGFGEILPKQFGKNEKKEIAIKIAFEINPPNNWSVFNLHPLCAEYEIGITTTRGNELKITKESLAVKSILLLEHFMEKDFETKTDAKQGDFDLSSEIIEEYTQSEIVFFKKRGEISYDINFDLSEQNCHLLLRWLGFGNFFNETGNRRITRGHLNKLIKIVLRTPPTRESIITPIISSNVLFFNFSGHFRNIIHQIRSYGRYDLLINELRHEQKISPENRVSITGDNIPSVVTKFSKSAPKSWRRIITTMSNISPYFADVNSQSLRAGKNYLLFKEIFDGRDIESWESSDGTLRALAILISVEAHREGSTILIEEPEHGLHPWAIKDLLSHIREVIRINNLQIILTTHSQQVLENIEQNELLVAERDLSGTHYHPLSEVLPNADISMGEIGELWTRGLLNGVPKSIK